MDDAAFYYDRAGDEVPLHPASTKALDVGKVDVEGLDGDVRDLVSDERAVARDLYLVPESDLDPEIERQLDEAGALHPTYLADDGTTIIVLPEVRVEDSGKSGLAEIRAAVEAGTLPAELAEDRGYRLKLRPTSGRGEDALELANQVHEQHHPDMVQARFVRITARPDSTKPPETGAAGKRPPTKGRKRKR